MTKHVRKVERIGGLCECGCGGQVEQPPGSGRPRKYIQGHAPGKRGTRICGRLCACGCGQPVVRRSPLGALPRYLEGHALGSK